MNQKPICALVIGHTQTSPGANNKASGLTEFDFNQALATDIGEAVQTVMVIRVYRESYKTLPAQINKLKPDFIISLHCNAFNQKASGTEVLFHQGSKKGQLLAGRLHNNLKKALGLPGRGIKPISKGQRGSYLLRLTQAPCVIAEPFFIDNDQDLQTARTRIDQLVKAYADTIEQYASTV